MSNVTQITTTVIIAAILIQFCVDRIKGIVGGRVMNYIGAPIWSLFLGIVFALTFNIDLFEIIGFSTYSPIISRVITGIVLSSGAAPVHELFEKLRESRGF